MLWYVFASGCASVNALGRKWRDVDWRGAKLRVERGIVRPKVDDVKTIYSGRMMPRISETLLAHFILDVSPEDLFKNLSDHPKARNPVFSAGTLLVSGHFWKEVHFRDQRGCGDLRP